MNAEKSFINKKNLFIKECFVNNFSEEQAEEIFNICLDLIRKLKEVRLSEPLTNVILENLISQTSNGMWTVKFNNYIANVYSYILSQIYQAINNDKTYWYSILRLGQFYNSKTKLNPIDLEGKYLTQIELEDLIFNELPTPQFRVSDDKKMNNLYDLVSGEIFDCTVEQFISSIEAAFFARSTIKSNNKAKEFVYRLHMLMGEEWYTAICKNMGWKKSDVSGRDVTFKAPLEKSLPRPNKRMK